jgi:proton-translocating NADH-quinone oxidoreductase chain N
MPFINLANLAPELYLAALALLVLVVDMFLPRGRSAITWTLALVGLAVCLRPILAQWGDAGVMDFSGCFVVDTMAAGFKVLFVLSGIAVLLLASDLLSPTAESPGEFICILLFTILGMCLMASASDLILIYLAFELVSLSSYLLAAWHRRSPASNEAGVKYFIYGAAASAVMLYGLTLLYGAGGSTSLTIIAHALMQPTEYHGLALPVVLGLVMMMVGFGYKISMVPFHAWAPDVYQGAPTAFTAFLSVGPKAAGFALLFRVFYTLAPAVHVPWQVIFAVLAVVTMFAGNLLAIRQTDIKRMLAYSSIAHAGYLLIGFVVGPDEPWGLTGVYVYLVAYLLMNLGVFAVAILRERQTGSTDITVQFGGLARSAPGLAALTAVLLLSLTGIPPTAGFLGKFYLFAAAVHSRQWAWLAFIGIINSVISLYYYMNIARAMYFGRPEHGEAEVPDGSAAILTSPAFSIPVLAVAAIALIGTLALFVFPAGLIEAARLMTVFH